MSYILDALKKSEKERQRGEVPNVLTVQDALPEEPRKRRLWPYLILVVMLVNAGIVAWLFGPWQSKKAIVVAPATPAKQVDAKPQGALPPVAARTADPEVRVAKEDTTGQTEQVVSRQTPQKERADQQKLPAEARTDTKKKGPDKPTPQVDAKKAPETPRVAAQDNKKGASVAAQPGPLSGNASSEPSPSEEIPPPAPNKLYSLNELPAPLKQKLPAIAISVSLYSDDPASRLVRINGQMMREGQLLSPGLKVEEIAPDGVIFSFQNYRFRIGLR